MPDGMGVDFGKSACQSRAQSAWFHRSPLWVAWQVLPGLHKPMGSRRVLWNVSMVRFKLSFGASDMEVQSHGGDHNNGMWSGSTDIDKILSPMSMASRWI